MTEVLSLGTPGPCCPPLSLQPQLAGRPEWAGLGAFGPWSQVGGLQTSLSLGLCPHLLSHRVIVVAVIAAVSICTADVRREARGHSGCVLGQGPVPGQWWVPRFVSVLTSAFSCENQKRLVHTTCHFPISHHHSHFSGDEMPRHTVCSILTRLPL